MFEYIKEKIAQNEKFVFTILPFMLVLVIFVNSNTVKSFFVGIPILMMYLLVNGEILGRAFFEEEKPFFRLTFGLFTLIVLMAVTGMLAVLVFQNEMWYLLGMFFAATVASLVNQVLVRYDGLQRKTSKVKRRFFESSFLKAVYVSYIVTFVLCFWILLNERSGWVHANPSIWAVIPFPFLRLYFIATAILVGILLLPGKVSLKLLLTALHSTFSLLFVPIILYPGIITEVWYDLGRARALLQVVPAFYHSASLGALEFVWAVNSVFKGFSVHILIVTFAGALNLDMYWSDVLLVPMMWGFFIPLTSYRLTEMIGGGKRACLLAALLTNSSFYFLAWGKLTMSNSLGNIFFVLLLYLFLRFLSSHETKIFIPIFITLVATAATHFLPMTMSISFIVIAFALKRYEQSRLKFRRAASFLLLFSFILSVFLEPSAVIGRGIMLPALGESAIDVNKLLSTSVWALVFGFSEQVPVQEAVLYYLIFLLLGLIGFAYALRRKAKFNKTLCLFLFLAFLVCIIDHRIRAYAMIGGLFGAGRFNFYRDIVALPFVALIIESAIKYLFGTVMKTRSFFRWKYILAGTMICIGMSSWVTLMVYDNYVYYTWGLMPTSFEVEAIKYIDEHTDGNYVVFTPWDTESIAWGFIGYPYPPGKKYVGFSGNSEKPPSLMEMFNQMKHANADVGYILAPSFRLASVDRFIRVASRVYGLFKVLSYENGEKIYIFEYKIPPLPRNPDVMAFYWDTPPTYYIQNDLVRIIVNPATKTLDVQDFWGGLYEGIKLNETLVGGHPIGNLTSIEYFDVMSNKWVEWSSILEIPQAEQFQFRLRFERESLIGVVQRGLGSIQLRWESGQPSTLSLEVGGFKRLYIPGLIGGKDSFDVNSREYGLLYTYSLTPNVVLHPAYKPDVNSTSLTYSQIVNYCGFILGEGYMWYDLYVDNTADTGQWAYIEVWLPDQVSTGVFPPFYYSVDGKTWVYVTYDVEKGSSVPLITFGGVEVNWIFSVPRFARPKPTEFWSYYSPTAQGGIPKLPENYTDSGGAQDRIIFGFYLPAGDKGLVRLGSGVYSPRPFVVSYVFRDSDNIAYGLHNLEEGSIKLYNFGVSEDVTGVTLTSFPTSLVISQDETNRIQSMEMALPFNTTFTLLAKKEVDTTIDRDADGIPDLI